MTASCYGLRVKKRPMTDDERARVDDAQRRIDRLAAEWDVAIKERNDLFRALHADGVGVTAMARMLGMHRTVVQRIVTPPLSARQS